MKLKKTKRGFGVINFKDQSGNKCSIQKSSIATGDCIWIGSDKIGLKEFVAFRQPNAWIDKIEVDEHTMEHHFVANNRMHLTRKQVAKLLPILQKFVETGDL